jgi:hypothetical protein
MDTHPDAISDPAVDPTLALSDADEYFESDTEDQSPEPTIADLVRELRQAKLREDALSQRADDDAMERLSLQRALETEKQLSNQLSDDLVNLSKLDRAEIKTHHATLLEAQKSAEIKAQRAALLEAQKTAEIEAQRAALLEAQKTKHKKHLLTNSSSVIESQRRTWNFELRWRSRTERETKTTRTESQRNEEQTARQSPMNRLRRSSPD